MTVRELSERLGGDLSGDGALEVCALASLQEARPGDVSFVKDAKYARMAASTRASAVLVPAGWQGECTAPARIYVKDPDAACTQAARWFAPPPVVRTPGIHPTAVIADDARLGRDVHVGPWTVIEAGAEIGDGSVIEAQVFIGQRARLGEGCHLYPQVTVREGCLLGRRVILHSGAVIGGDGFSFVTPEKSGVEEIRETLGERKEIREQHWTRIHSLGGVELGDDVEVGANSTLDRGTIRATRIGRGTKIDSQVQVGHNVVVGEDCLLCGLAAFAEAAMIRAATFNCSLNRPTAALPSGTV